VVAVTAFSTQLVAPTDTARCGYELNNTTWTANGDSAVRIGEGNGSQNWRGGLVFVLNVPQGATINTGTMTLYTNATDTGTGNITISAYADANLTQSNYGSSDRPSQATPTTAFGSVVNPTTTANTSFTIDIATVLQEIVSKPGWSTGSLIRFIMNHNMAGTAYRNRGINAANAYSNTSNEPAISGDYTAGGVAIPIVMHHRRMMDR
jgi:hypothetical protein